MKSPSDIYNPIKGQKRDHLLQTYEHYLENVTSITAMQPSIKHIIYKIQRAYGSCRED